MAPVVSASDLQFCPLCGSVMPPPVQDMSRIPCKRCPFTRDIKDFEKVVEEFQIQYNAPKQRVTNEEGNQQQETPEDFEGPSVERHCPKCNHDTNWTYTTRQTRGADEGQTVFYTCVVCKLQDIEYS